MVSAEIHRLIRQAFLGQLHAHPLTMSIAHAMIRTDDDPLMIIACWWMAFKFEERESHLPIEDLITLFPSVVTHERVCNAERMILVRQSFFMPYRTPMRAIYDLLPVESAHEYHDWLSNLEEHKVLHSFSPIDWVNILTATVNRTSIPTSVQAIASMFRARHRRRLCPSSPRLTYHAKSKGINKSPLAIRIIDCV